MICPNCKHNVRSDIHICPHCGSKLEEVKTAKVAKSKVIVEEDNTFVGGTVSKSSFLTLQKKNNTKKKEILRKDYNNYIDYKEAKERALEEMNKPNSSKNRSIISVIADDKIHDESGTVSGRTVSKRKDVNKDVKVVNKNNAINPLITINFEDNSKKALRIEKVSKNRRYNLISNIITICIFVLWIGVVYYLVTKPELSYYFHENANDIIRQSGTDNTLVDEEMLKYQSVSKSGQTGGVSSEGITTIIYDNQYLKQFNIKDESDVFKLISTDSIKQKNTCPNNITKIENEIITNYGITAVNLCEMDEEFAMEIRDVIKFIYNSYPSARDYLTNLTLANVDEGATYMAAFMPVFTFATSNTSNGYPVGVKTQIILNAKYFLNLSKIKSSVNYGSKSGYFPPNATRSSAVAHEFGHYLSYVGLLNHYKSQRLVFVKAGQSKLLYDVYQDFNDGTFSYQLLIEAFNDYSKTVTNASFEDFRNSISKYAVAKDTAGNFIYDETIAEAFHDVYINGEKAQVASKYIVDKLLSKI